MARTLGLGVFTIALACAVVTASPASAQLPESRGALAFEEWDAGRVAVAGTTIPTRVLYPGGAGPFPLVGVIHGAGRTGARHLELARTLASRGYVVVLPDLPCTPFACDHAANAAQITGLLEWAVAQSETAASRLAGRVDGGRRGLVGHSWGALASHLAASRDDTIDSLVLFDPNDDGTVGRMATASITAPTLQLLAAVPGTCNSQWDEAAVTSMLAAPRAQLTVSRSGHCDPEQPGDSLCPLACGSGDPATATTFRRYAVAWTECVLSAAPEMAPWLGGESFDADESGDVIRGVLTSRLDELPCRAGGSDVDAGTGELDAGASHASDAGGDEDAGATGGVDAGGTTPRDAAPLDASAPDPGSAPGASGCGCRAGGARPRSGAALVVLLALGLGASRLRVRRGAR